MKKISYDVRTILAVQLRRLRIKNPLIYILIILLGNVFIYLVNYDFFNGLEVNEISLNGFFDWVRDGLILLLSSITVSTFTDLPEDHPDKVAAFGEAEGEKENL